LISLWASESVNGLGRKSSATVIAGSSVIRRNASASVGPRGRRRKRSVVIGKRDERQSHDALLAREKRLRKPCRVKAKRFPSCRRRVIHVISRERKRLPLVPRFRTYRWIATDGASPHLKNELAAEMPRLADAMGLGGLR
jgi:hypothetical protein